MTNDLTRLRDTDLNNPGDLMKEVPMLSFQCKICKEQVAEVSDKWVKENILYGRLEKFIIYCKKCHDELDAVQARLQGHAKLIFFSDEQLPILQEILERETKKFIKDQELQDSIKNDNYDAIKLNKSIQINKMYLRVNKSMSELGLFKSG